MSLSERLNAVLKDKSLKVTDFSKITGIPYSTCQSYLKGTREPGTEMLTAISLQLYVNLNWLLTGRGEMFIGSGGGESLTPSEQTLLEDYRESNEQGKEAIEKTASALAGKASSQQRSRTTMHIGKVEQQNHIDSLVGDLVFKKGK